MNINIFFPKTFSIVFKTETGLLLDGNDGSPLLTLSQTSPGFLRVCSTILLKKLWKKEKLLVTSNFSFSYSVFYPLEEIFAIFNRYEIVVCKLFKSGRA